MSSLFGSMFSSQNTTKAGTNKAKYVVSSVQEQGSTLKIQCILAQPQYKNESRMKLRIEDYNSNQCAKRQPDPSKTNNAMGLQNKFGQTTSPFGQPPSPFGQPASPFAPANKSPFGQTSNSPLFGQKPSPGFGTNPTNPFGQTQGLGGFGTQPTNPSPFATPQANSSPFAPQQPNSPFGSPTPTSPFAPQQSTSPFGINQPNQSPLGTTNSPFATPSQPSSPFGNPTNSPLGMQQPNTGNNLFGNKGTTGGIFGQSANQTQNRFGTTFPSSPATPGPFGQTTTNTAPTSPFGATNPTNPFAKPGNSTFGNTTTATSPFGNTTGGGLFGNPSGTPANSAFPSTSSPFGQNLTSSNPPNSSPFASPSNPSPFNNSSTPFGQTGSSSPFGQSNSAPSLFGQTTNNTSAFGQSTTGTSLFGNTGLNANKDLMGTSGTLGNTSNAFGSTGGGSPFASSSNPLGSGSLFGSARGGSSLMNTSGTGGGLFGGGSNTQTQVINQPMINPFNTAPGAPQDPSALTTFWATKLKIEEAPITLGQKYGRFTRLPANDQGFTPVLPITAASQLSFNPPRSKNPPALRQRLYFTVPPIRALENMDDHTLSQIKDLEVGHKEVGSVKFPGTTDVRGLILDDLIQFTPGEGVQLFGGLKDDEIPNRGCGLNKTAVLTLKYGASETKEAAATEGVLRQYCLENELEFVGFDESNGEFQCMLHYFY